ncbi:MAG TPA: methyltransferase domain-containing protein [Chloroflexota bacterium]|nr:methyltransferase domain-containing protein [Chloroflexota bacterium]
MPVFVCPVCHGPLDERGAAGVVCSSCGRGFPNRGGALDFTPNPPPHPDVSERWPLWEQLQHNFLVAAEEIPEHSLSLGDREDARAFAEFADLRGNVLDIGCGPQREPSYAMSAGAEFVGIDPVRGELERSFHFVQGLGEYLPFPDGAFDRVLFATSLDHVLSPVRALSESRRVIGASGSVNIWFGEVTDPEAPDPLWRRLARAARHPVAVTASLLRARRQPPAPVPAYQRELTIPEGATDLFHVVHLSHPLVTDWLRQAGLRVSEVGRHGPSAFIRAVPADASP